MTQKPLTEVLARTLVAERYRLNPDLSAPWDNMSDEAQDMELGAMHEVVRTLGMFGWEVFEDDKGIGVRRIRVIDDTRKAAKRATKKVEDALDPLATQQEAGMVRKQPEAQELCGVCGQLAVVRESACRTRCMACDSIDGGCG